MKLVNMIKERGYENTIEDAIRIAAPYLNDEKNVKEILNEWAKKGIVAPEIYQYFEIKLETSAIIMKIERLFAEYGHKVCGVIYFLDREKRSPGHYGTVYYIAAPHLGEDFLKNMTSFEIGPNKGICGKAIANKNIFTSDQLSKENCYTSDQIELFEKYNLNACASIPIIVNHKVVATCALFSQEPLGELKLPLRKRLMNKIHNLENTFARLQYQWKSIRKISVSTIIDADGYLIYADSNIENLIGYHPGDFLGLENKVSYDSLTIFEDIPYLQSAFRQAKEKKVTTSAIHRIFTKEIGTIVLESNFTPVMDEENNIRYIAVTNMTNTIRCKQFERDLKVLNENVD